MGFKVLCGMLIARLQVCILLSDLSRFKLNSYFHLIFLGDVNGSMSVSKTDRRGSNPCREAKYAGFLLREDSAFQADGLGLNPGSRSKGYYVSSIFY